MLAGSRIAKVVVINAWFSVNRSTHDVDMLQIMKGTCSIAILNPSDTREFQTLDVCIAAVGVEGGGAFFMAVFSLPLDVFSCNGAFRISFYH